MSIPSFTFTRNPSTKVSVDIELSGLVQADNELIIVGRMAASGASAPENVPYQVLNYGDPVAVVVELDAIFGAGAEATQMVVSAIKANLYGDAVSVVFPPIKVIPMASTRVATDLASCLAANIGLPMPFVAVPFPMTDEDAFPALKAHVTAISAADRGGNGQFGSFGCMASIDTYSNSASAGVAIASQNMILPWLQDSESSNSVAQIAAAYAAACASNGQPFNPLNDRKVGGLITPTVKSDWATTGDAGTISLGLDSGIVPLYIKADGSVCISRAITSYRPVSGSPASAYYDLPDWQVLYYYRKNAYLLCQENRYRIAKATDKKLLALKSELVQLAKDFEALEMFQHVDKLVDQFTVTRPLDNRFAGVYAVPVNVVPGFMNKGIGLVGTELFDTFQLA